ncbi:MAG TPA: hypothetical protein VLA79_00565 [Polyangia bacterium]|nr:hypothetical protein [Polyangia bacterium]
MWETFEAAVGFIPHGRLLVAAVLAVCGAQLCAIVLGLRRRLSPGAQAIQGTSLLLIPIVAAVSFRASWMTTLGALAGAPASGVQAFTDGLNGLVNASPMAAVGTLIALELWAIGLAVALGSEPEMPATAARGALVFAGLSATLVGVVLCGSYAIHELASLADVEPERKATMLRAALDFTRDHLMRSPSSRVGRSWGWARWRWCSWSATRRPRRGAGSRGRRCARPCCCCSPPG